MLGLLSVASVILARRVDFHVVVDVGQAHEGLVLIDCRMVAERKRDRDSFGPNRPESHIHITPAVGLICGAIPVVANRNRFDLLKTQVGQFVALAYTSHANLDAANE